MLAPASMDHSTLPLGANRRILPVNEAATTPPPGAMRTMSPVGSIGKLPSVSPSHDRTVTQLLPDTFDSAATVPSGASEAKLPEPTSTRVHPYARQPRTESEPSMSGGSSCSSAPAQMSAVGASAGAPQPATVTAKVHAAVHELMLLSRLR